MRLASFAGTFYKKGELSLKKQLQACFEDERGPGATSPEAQRQKTAKAPQAVVAPHAAYEYSGACAAWSYKAIGDAPLADVYIILAPSHHAGKSGLSQEPVQTPLGTVRVDQDLARRLLEKGTITEDEQPFQEEHALEVQLPFLQFSQIEAVERIKILPLIISHDIDLQQLAFDLKEVLLDTGKQAVYIVSSDFTHYGRQYHYLPFSSDIAENLSKLDEGAINHLKHLDSEGLLRYADEKMTNICGLYPLALLCRLLKPGKVNVEQYYTSAAVTKDEKNQVSYASIVFT